LGYTMIQSRRLLIWDNLDKIERVSVPTKPVFHPGDHQLFSNLDGVSFNFEMYMPGLFQQVQ